MIGRRLFSIGLTSVAMVAMSAAVPGGVLGPGSPAAAAEYKEFGADLSRTANSTVKCGDPIPYAFAWGSSSCTWWGIGSATDSSEAAMVPYPGGTVRRVWVKTGPVTGPMKVTVIGLIRAEGSTASPGCCFYRRESQVFTPAPNAVSEIAVNLPVRHELNPITNAWDYDVLALTVLDPSVPVPAHYTGVANPSGLGIASASMYPALEASNPERVDTYALAEFQTLLRAELELGTAGGGGGGGITPDPQPAPDPQPDPVPDPQPDPGPIAPVVGTPGIQKALVRQDKVVADLVCSAGGPCAGTATLTAKRRAQVSAAAQSLMLGKRAYRMAAGATGKVTVKLSAKGAKYVQANRRVPAKLILKNADGSILASKSVTLRR